MKSDASVGGMWFSRHPVAYVSSMWTVGDIEVSTEDETTSCGDTMQCFRQSSPDSRTLAECVGGGVPSMLIDGYNINCLTRCAHYGAMHPQETSRHDVQKSDILFSDKPLRNHD